MRAISTRRQRAFVLFVVVLAGLTAWSVTPAAAASNKAEQSADLQPACHRGCGDVQPVRRKLDRRTRRRRPRAGPRRGPRGAPGVREGQGRQELPQSVPVWFHVVSDGAIGNISNTVIREQMNVLNLAFAGFYGGANTGSRSGSPAVTRTDNAAWHYAGTCGYRRARDEAGAPPRRSRDAEHLRDDRGAYLGWAYLPDIVTKPGQDVPRRHRRRLGVHARCVDDVRRQVRPRPDRDPRGRPLAQPRAHVLRRLQREGRLRRRHAGADDPDERLSRRARTRAERRGSTRSTTTWTTRTTPVTGSSRRARRSACATPGSSGAHSAGNYEPMRDGPAQAGPFSFGLDSLSPSARSSGDRALASGARGRRFESCRAHSRVQETFTTRRYLASVQHRKDA